MEDEELIQQIEWLHIRKTTGLLIWLIPSYLLGHINKTSHKLCYYVPFDSYIIVIDLPSVLMQVVQL